MNKSGITPCGDRVLVLPDPLEETTDWGLIIPPSEHEKYQMAQVSGTLVAVGPDAWLHTVTETKQLLDGVMRTVEIKKAGYSGPFAELGDRILFNRYVGQIISGKDGNEYRLLNDEDIMGIADDDVDFTEFRKRKPLSKQETGNV